MSRPPDPDKGLRDIWFTLFLVIALAILVTTVIIALATVREPYNALNRARPRFTARLTAPACARVRLARLTR